MSLGIQFGCQPGSFVELLDDLDTELRVTACDKKSFRAMSKSNAGAFQVLKSQVKTALENHRDIIDECKKETAKTSKETIFSDDSKGESKSSGKKNKKERKPTESGKSARARARAPGQDERRIELGPAAFSQNFATFSLAQAKAYSQEQKRRVQSRALSKVPRQWHDDAT